MEGQEERPARKQVSLFQNNRSYWFFLPILIPPTSHFTIFCVQVDKPITELEDSNDPAQYNIWTHRKLKEFRTPREGRGTKHRSEYRCHPKLDSGWTRGSKSGCSYCCLYFARGICHHGQDCNYLHRVPSEADEMRHRGEPQYDIFGRDRHVEARGTKRLGSMDRQITTLYVYLGGAAAVPSETLQRLLMDAFGEFGPVDDVKVVASKAIAFVRYRWRSSAEFGKAAMHQQTLGKKGVDANADTVLDVRWANDDPNPRAQVRDKRAQEEAMANAYMEAVSQLDPVAKRARLHELSLSAGYLPGAAVSAYPDTSGQYDEQYEGWDARAYAEAQEQGGVSVDAIQTAAVEQQEASKGWRRRGAVQGVRADEHPDAAVEDDVSRYLLPEDILEDGGGGTGGREVGRRGGSAGAEGEGAVAGRQAAGDSPAEDALGLISGYGSSSDND